MPDMPQLLFGPYQAPRLRVGDRAMCLVRDCLVVITSWSDAPISWPRCRTLESRGGGSGLLVEDELARAIRNESALAIKYWFGVKSGAAVWRWRKALGVARMESEGSRRLIRAAVETGATVQRGLRLPADQVERRRQTAIELNLGQHLQTGYHGEHWTEADLQLLGTLPDAQVAAIIGKTVTAVRVKRTKLGISTAEDGRKRKPTTVQVDEPPEKPPAPRKQRARSTMEPAWKANRGRKHTKKDRKKMSQAHRNRGTIPPGLRPWTAEEDKLVRQLPASKVVARTGRTLSAVYTRRSILGLNDGRTVRWRGHLCP
jgi:hypothetical protein